jgi:Cu(I)/Ag(I) efflux system membrane fusion protein
MFLVIAACTGDQTNDKIVVVTGGGHSSTSTEDFDANRFSCCADQAITDVISAYIDLNDALADDAPERAQAAGQTLATQAAQAAQAAQLSEADRALAAQIASLTKAWEGSDIAGVRSTLQEVTAAALPLAKTHKGDGPLTAVIAFCPMAPGRWLQSRPDLRNPYYGAQMLSCGVFEEST